MSCSKDFVRFVCFCIVHKVSVYWHITSPEGSVGVGGGCVWSARERFCSSHSMWSRISVAWPFPVSTHWCKLFISFVSTVNLACLVDISSSGWPSVSGPPTATVVSEPMVLLSLLTKPVIHSLSSMWRLMSLCIGHPVPPWWVAIACVLYVV